MRQTPSDKFRYRTTAGITDSLAWATSADTDAIATSRGAQIGRSSSLVRGCLPTQEQWFNSTPESIRGEQARFQAVAYHQLMRHFDLGGADWVRQFIFGFPTTGILSQPGVFPASNTAKPPLPVSAIWNSSVKRFNVRDSGYRNIDALWGDAISHV